MTDQTARDVTDDDRRVARDWAEHIFNTPDASLPMETAAARVILDVVPAPPPPTLADMTPKERAACRWMQADVEHRGRAVVIVPEWGAGHAELLNRRGSVFYAAHDRATPRPDLPRMTWPGEQQPAPAPALPAGWRLADHREYGRGIVTTPTPDIDGRVYVVRPADDPMGYDWFFSDPDDLTYLDQEAGTPEAVPPNTLAVGSVWRYRDALARACEKSGRDQIVALDRAGDAYVWSHEAEWWVDSGPLAEFAPFTILHAGKKADQ